MQVFTGLELFETFGRLYMAMATLQTFAAKIESTWPEADLMRWADDGGREPARDPQ